MATVKEVKLMKDGAMVTPLTLIDSVKNLDGTKYKDTVTSALNGKANSSHTHDDRYYTESEITNLLNGKANSTHTHDDRYYTESEITNLLNGKANSTHDHVTWNNTSSEQWATDGTIVEYQIPTVALGETAYIRHTFSNTYSGGNLSSCTFRVKAPSGGSMYCVSANSTFIQGEKFYSPSEIVSDIEVIAGTSETIYIRCTRIA